MKQDLFKSDMNIKKFDYIYIYIYNKTSDRKKLEKVAQSGRNIYNMIISKEILT